MTTRTPTIVEIREYLSGFLQEGGENWQEENERYLDAHAHRFHESLRFMPPATPGERLLELGAAPYFTTLLLKKYYPYSISISNAVIPGEPLESSIKLNKPAIGAEHVFEYQTFNVELDRYPYPDHSFDTVLCWEILEHLPLDPTHMLLEIHRALKPGGKLLITTPNVLVLRNILALLKNRQNIYHPYSGYGVYGRHNREWTLDELTQILNGCGYSIRVAEIVDTYAHRGYSKILKRLFPSLRDMLVVLAQAETEAQPYYPENLYTSLPKKYLSENPLPSRLQDP